jgi:muramoyltetrapeptide carboxypeptidase LdcA involved in peptidoglycan recycling
MAFISIKLVLTVEKEGLFIRWHARRMIGYSDLAVVAALLRNLTITLSIRSVSALTL